MIESLTIDANKSQSRWAMASLLWVLFSLAGGACRSNDNKANIKPVIRVFYVPIGAQTLTAVTTENIEERGQQCLIESQAKIDQIGHLLLSGHSPLPSDKFTNTGVRVKIYEIINKNANLIAIVENEGYIKRLDGHDQVLSTKDLAALKKLIESQCK